MKKKLQWPKIVAFTVIGFAVITILFEILTLSGNGWLIVSVSSGGHNTDNERGSTLQQTGSDLTTTTPRPKSRLLDNEPSATSLDEASATSADQNDTQSLPGDDRMGRPWFAQGQRPMNRPYPAGVNRPQAALPGSLSSSSFATWSTMSSSSFGTWPKPKFTSSPSSIIPWSLMTSPIYGSTSPSTFWAPTWLLSSTRIPMSNPTMITSEISQPSKGTLRTKIPDISTSVYASPTTPIQTQFPIIDGKLSTPDTSSRGTLEHTPTTSTHSILKQSTKSSTDIDGSTYTQTGTHVSTASGRTTQIRDKTEYASNSVPTPQMSTKHGPDTIIQSSMSNAPITDALFSQNTQPTLSRTPKGFTTENVNGLARRTTYLTQTQLTSQTTTIDVRGTSPADISTSTSLSSSLILNGTNVRTQTTTDMSTSTFKTTDQGSQTSQKTFSSSQQQDGNTSDGPSGATETNPKPQTGVTLKVDSTAQTTSGNVDSTGDKNRTTEAGSFVTTTDSSTGAINGTSEPSSGMVLTSSPSSVIAELSTLSPSSTSTGDRKNTDEGTKSSSVATTTRAIGQSTDSTIGISLPSINDASTSRGPSSSRTTLMSAFDMARRKPVMSSPSSDIAIFSSEPIPLRTLKSDFEIARRLRRQESSSSSQSSRSDDMDALGDSYWTMHMGIWNIRLCGLSTERSACFTVSSKIGFTMLKAKSLDTLSEDTGGMATWNDLRVETMFALLAAVVGLVCAVLSVRPFCLRTTRRATAVIGAVGFLLSGILFIVAMAKISSVSQDMKNAFVRIDRAFVVNTPWAVVISGIGVGLALLSAVMLLLYRWAEERGIWQKFADDNTAVSYSVDNQPRGSSAPASVAADNHAFSSALYDGTPGTGTEPENHYYTLAAGQTHAAPALNGTAGSV